MRFTDAAGGLWPSLTSSTLQNSGQPLLVLGFSESQDLGLGKLLNLAPRKLIRSWLQIRVALGTRLHLRLRLHCRHLHGHRPSRLQPLVGLNPRVTSSAEWYIRILDVTSTLYYWKVDLYRLYHPFVSLACVGNTQSACHCQVERHILRLYERAQSRLLLDEVFFF